MEQTPETDPDDDWKMAILEEVDLLKKINSKLNIFVVILIVVIILQIFAWILR